ncbi:uncharacterized protein K444DRAFT_635945 [Hyaloscypha bicolor E]|uniref:Mid2 domain-containing protein n=1 Tax=Hyaloscypha bicolor E TaxID=1095630 RepID=A0A2J6SQI5_9HELO|nr:uncharacterized protein K444DRAFT_635945 [Hyaloscypha bicolor E]PMD53037.1 hypothetical protein K444DRAFT_635945 [Hyaloscypha bicolor E]
MDTFRVLTRLIAAAVLMSGANALSITTQPPWFQGYWIENDLTTSTLSCATSETFLTYLHYATCCDTALVATGLCLPATECLGHILTKQGGSTSNCGSSYSCATIDIFQTSPVGGQIPITNVVCATGWSAYTIFQDLPTTTSTSSSSTPTASSVTSTTPFSKGSSPAATPTPTPTPHSSSKAWVAGAVIGPLAITIALGVFGFWIGRRRAKATALEAVPRYNPVSKSQAGTSESRWSPYPLYELESDER